MFHKFIKCIVVFSLIACQEKDCPATHELIHFDVIDTIRIDVSESQYEFDVIRQSSLDPDLLYLFDNGNIEMTVFDLVKEEIIKNIVFTQEGPNSLNGSHFSFNIIGKDSILFLNDIRGLLLYDENGNKYWEKYITDDWFPGNYNVDKLNLFALGVPNYVSMPFQYNLRKKELYALCLWQESWRNTEALWDEFQQPVLAKINPFEENGAFLGEYPFNLSTNKLPFSILPHFTTNDTTVFIQFDYSPKVYLSGDFHCARSLFDKDDYTTYERGIWLAEDQEVRPYQIEGGYNGIYYDKWRDVYYRVYKHPQMPLNREGIYNQTLNARFSILILDKNADTIGEIVFKNNYYNFLDLFIVESGLLLSTENPFNPKFEENTYEFHLIKIKFPHKNNMH